MSYEHKTDIENSLFQYSKQTERYFEFTSWYDELQEVYERAGKAEENERKAEEFDALQEGLNKLIDEYDKKARGEFEHGFIGPATEALDIKKKIKNILDYKSEAE